MAGGIGGEPGAFKDPGDGSLLGCLLTVLSFFKSSVICQSSIGGRLATVTSAARFAMIAAHVKGPLVDRGERARATGEPAA
jgi:hypothetical protein